eukprot:CAMPEP_0113580572 /NCGR_PEP_ID=MMETSP0015_2-20120614/30764_1 /TAXON_ID=2838 /ORGANISM="Odontella" /LENGTH=455 /DNA_ID=CAMNT_0000484809 /DNA_START=129 /DNA_END=1496 /DNA_ORIENTATION=- /assembly_acc=CAM_ASM_000160
MATSTLQAAVVDGGIWVLWFILTAIDIVLIFLSKIISSDDSDSNCTKEKTRIVIVGASFAGLSVYRDLIRHSNPGEVEITAIDYRDFFEYNPGILRCFVNPSYLTSLTCKLSALNNDGRGSRFVQGEVVGVNPSANTVALKSGKVISYDFLVLATGSTYPGTIKTTTVESTLSQRQMQMNQQAKVVCDAATIFIVGGGAVGVELAGEIAETYPKKDKRVVIMDMANTILPGFQQETKDYCKHWLETNGIEIVLGTSLKAIDEKSVTFQDGSKQFADLIFKCVGAAPASGFLKAEQSGDLAKVLSGPKGSVVANDHLQVEGFDNIFCAGDVCYHSSSNELKLAHTAHVNGSLVALNVLRLVRGQSNSLLSYPHGLYGNDKTPKIYNVSLGKYDSSLGFNSLMIHGVLPAVVKWLIEWTQVAAAANRPVGKLFWIVADWVSFFLGRTIFLPSKSKAE